MAEFEERTQQATPRKKQKAREQGQVPRSPELTSMVATGGIILMLYLGGEHFLSAIYDMTKGLLSLRYGVDTLQVFKVTSLQTLQILTPFLLVAMVLGTLTALAQGGFVMKPLSIELERINPFVGIGRIFSFKGFTEFLKALFKFGIGIWIFYYLIKKNLNVLPSLSAMEMNKLLTVSGHMLINVLATAFICFFTIAIFSYALERWQFERSLRMTPAEVKEEYKESEGDPLIKSRVRSLQREVARRRMMQEVPKATVVITNPTHIAVALKYEDKKMLAPKIIAKGAGIIAEKIKEIAKEHGIPIFEDKPLARALFKLDLGTFIPEELYVAVARILAHVYKLRGMA